MAWKVEFDDSARRAFRKLNPSIQDQILRYLRQRIATNDDPRRFGKALSGDKAGLWRYRVGDCRVICDIQDGALRVLVVQVGNRRDVYQKT